MNNPGENVSDRCRVCSSVFITIKRKRNLNGEFIKIFEEVFSQKVLPDDGLPRAVCDTCRYRIETSWERKFKSSAIIPAEASLLLVYHPHWTVTENDCMRDHLFQSLLLAESRFPNCGLIVAGDFNPLDLKSIQRQFRLKQIVKKPTRKNAILDLVFTNMHGFYADPQHFHLLDSPITTLSP